MWKKQIRSQVILSVTWSKWRVNSHWMVACQCSGYFSGFNTHTHTDVIHGGRKNSHTMLTVNKSAPGPHITFPTPFTPSGWAASLRVFLCAVPVILLHSGSPAYVGHLIRGALSQSLKSTTDLTIARLIHVHWFPLSLSTHLIKPLPKLHLR